MYKYIISKKNNDIEKKIIDFHKSEFIISQMETYGLYEIFPSIYDKFYIQAEKLSKNIIPILIKTIKKWISQHDEENSQLVFESRYSAFLKSLNEEEDFNISDVISKKIKNDFRFECLTFDQIYNYSKNKEKFLSELTVFFTGYSIDYYWDFIIDDEIKNIRYENPEISEDEIELKAEELKKNIDLYMIKEIIESYIEGEGYNGIYLSAYSFYNMSEVKNAIKNWFYSIGFDKMFQIFEERRSKNKNYWIQNTNNYQLVQNAKKCVKRLIDSQWKSIKEKQIAITLALNLKHNTGKLIEDHIGNDDISYDFLNNLNELNIEKEKKIIQNMILKSKKSKENLIEEEYLKKENEKYYNDRINDMWKWKKHREIFGKNRWYKRKIS